MFDSFLYCFFSINSDPTSVWRREVHPCIKSISSRNLILKISHSFVQINNQTFAWAANPVKRYSDQIPLLHPVRSGPVPPSKPNNKKQIAEKFSFTWSTCSISAVLIHSFTWIIFKIVWLMVIAPWSRPTAHRAVLSIVHEYNAAKNPSKKKKATEDSDVGIYITSRSEMSYHSIQRCLTAPHTSQTQSEKSWVKQKKTEKTVSDIQT